jgi:hypothetical protein
MADLRERQEAALARVLCFSDVHHPQPDSVYEPTCSICVELAELAVVAVWDNALAEGRRQRDAELFTAQPDAPVDDDETPALMARYERELRAKIAGEIRAEATRQISAQSSWFWFERGEKWLEEAAEWAARIVEGLSPAERAERYLRESRQRQAGLDYERIERARAAQAGPGTQREV